MRKFFGRFRIAPGDAPHSAACSRVLTSRRMLSNSVVTVLNSARNTLALGLCTINVAAKVNNLRLRRANHVQ